MPHNTKRFPGFRVEKGEVQKDKRGKVIDTEKSKNVYNAKVHREHIFGIHVQNYYNQLKKDDANAFKRQFSQWTKCLEANKAKTFEELYKKAHAEIRKNPDRVKVQRKHQAVRKTITKAPFLVQEDHNGKRWLRQKRMSQALRKHRVAQRIRVAMGMAPEEFKEIEV